MTSKVINMVERMKDDEDLVLEALFSAEPIADEGFSNKVVSRVRRRLWIRRLSLPVAAVVGLVIALPPALELFPVFGSLLPQMPFARLAPAGLIGSVAGTSPQLSLYSLLPLATLAVLCLLPVFDD